MSHFYGVVQGSRGEASRTGGKPSGMRATAASFSGAVSVLAYHDKATGEDWCRVILGTWRGAGQEPAVTLYHGPMSRYEPQD